MYEHFWKRVIDIVLSTVGIVVLAIPMLIVALIIKIDSPGPVLFKQKRIGIHKSTFTILKFRSMPVNVPHDTPTHQFKAEDMLFAVFELDCQNPNSARGNGDSKRRSSPVNGCRNSSTAAWSA